MNAPKCMSHYISSFHTGRALFKAQSGSLDSISTALSLQTQHSLQTRSTSVDNIPQTIPAKVEDGKKYALLETETSSIISSSRNGGGEIRLTQSLPAVMERHVGEAMSSGRENQSGFSDNFIVTGDESDSRNSSTEVCI